MANIGFRELLIGAILFTVISVAIVGSIYEIGSNYDVSGEKMNEATAGAYNYSAYQNELEQSQTDAETYRQRFESGEISDVDDASGIFSVLKDVGSTIISPFLLLSNVLRKISVPEFAIVAVNSIIIFLVLFGVWRVLRSGE